MADIDSLSIQIESSSEKAIQQIDKVIAALGRLKAASEQKYGFKSISDSLKEINSSTFSKIRQLSESLKTLSTVGKISISDSLAYNIADLGDAINGINENALRKLGFFGGALRQLEGLSKITISPKLGNSIGDMIAALDLMEQGHIDRLQQFGTAMQALKGIGSKTGAALEKLPMQLAKLADEMDHISVGGIAKLDKMCAALSKLQGVSLTGFSAAVKQAKKEMEQAAKVNESGDMGAGGLTDSFVTHINDAREMIEALSPGLSKLFDQFDLLGAKIDMAFENARERIVNVKAALLDTENLKFDFSWANNVKQIEKYWRNVGQAIVGDVSPSLKIVISLVGKLASSVLTVARNIAKWAFHTAINAVKNIWNIMKKIASTALDVAKKLPAAFGKLTGISNITKSIDSFLKPLKSLGRIALYRAARTAIKFVTDALQQGAERAYFYAKQFGDATRYIADALDALSSKNFKMQNQLGAAWATLLATIQPILIQIINVVTRAAEVVTQFFAIMSGSGTYLKAKDYTKAWADETENGAAAAKEWKNQILGFDEINRLEAPSDTNRGSGNNDYTDYENMFEEAKVESRFVDFFRTIREMIQQGRWGELGTLLSDKFNSLVTNFDWAGWGKKLGKGIQGAIDLAYNFLKSDGFRNLGRGLMEMLDNLGSQMDFNWLGRLTVRIRTAIWDIFYGAVEYLAEPGVARNLAMRMSDFIIGAMQELTEWIASLDPHKIATAIKEFFGGIKYNEIRDSFVELIKTAWNFAVELKNEIWNEETKQKVSDAISDFFGDLTWEDIWKTVKEKLSTVWGWVSDKFEEIWPKDKRDEFGQKVKNFIANALDSIDWKAIHNLLAYYLDVIVFGKDTADRMWYNKGEYAGRDLIIGAETGIKMQQQAWEQSVSGYITDPVAEALHEMEKKATGSGKVLSEGVKKAADDSKSSVGSMKVEINRDSSTIKSDMDKIGNSTKTVSSSMQSMQSRSNSAMRNMASTANSSSRSIVSSLSQVVAKARESFNSLNSMSGAKFSATVTPGKIKRYATGGFIEDGLFTMNHGEIAGKFSNGQSVAANNEQIKDGIAAAVYGAFTRAFAETGGVSGSSGPHVAILQVNGREFARATYDDQKAVAREKGISMISNFA